MATQPTAVEDAEDLIRSVPDAPECHGKDPDTGVPKISASAFNDPYLQPSLDRRKMLASLEDAKRHPSHGLVRVVAREVRSIVDVQIIKKDKPTGTCYKFDVVHRPVDENNPDKLPPNPAHSQVESDPVLNGSRFHKLKERLARIATRHGWITPPGQPAS